MIKAGLKRRLKTEKYLRTNDSDNSFLVETSLNSDIDLNVRNEIESKYQQSKINSNYIFPRVTLHKKNRSKHLSTKNSFENLGKASAAHKTTKSAINPISSINLDKGHDKSLSKKMTFSLKFPVQPKHDEKKSLTKFRGISYREIKTERNHQSKSPKSKKKYMGIYAKNGTLTSKKIGSTDFMNKIFTPYNSNAKILNTAASMRLKKIFYNVKQNQLN